jgi:hypothetical protein
MRNKRAQWKGLTMLTRAALVLACWALLPARLTVALALLVLILWLADRRTLGGMLLAHALERRLNRPQRPVVVQTTRAAPIRPARVERLSQRRIRARPAPRLRALPSPNPAEAVTLVVPRHESPTLIAPRPASPPALSVGDQEVVRWLQSLGHAEGRARAALASVDPSCTGDARALAALDRLRTPWQPP